MIENLLRSVIAQQLLIDLVTKRDVRLNLGTLTSVVHQIESRKAHLTLRSAERAPTLSADRNLNRPFSDWRGVFLLFYLLSFKKIVYYFLVKVDGHVSRVERDKCPVH
jgi:hypothetical protein